MQINTQQITKPGKLTARQIIKRALISKAVADLVEECSLAENYVDLRTLMARIEIEIIYAVISERGSKSQASYDLEMNRTTLVEKLKRWGRRK